MSASAASVALDRAVFSRALNLIAVRVQIKGTHTTTRALGKELIFHHPSIKSIVIPTDATGAGSHRLVLLREHVRAGACVAICAQHTPAS